MDLLQLSKRLQLEVGASGSPVTVTGATGEWNRLVTWTNQAWEDIQRERDGWMWMRKTVTFNAIKDQGSYAPDVAPVSLTDFADWFRGTFRIYTNGNIDDETHLSDTDYDIFRDTYLYGTTRSTTGYPTVITVAPDKSLVLSLIPESNIYTVTGDYYSTPTTLAADSDTPSMPERFHMAIVYKAMMMYGAYESAQEVYARGEASYRKMLTQLEIDQLPPIVVIRDDC